MVGVKHETIIIELRLSTLEAEWLKAVMQNPLHDDEDEGDSEYRCDLFNTLAKLLKDR